MSEKNSTTPVRLKAGMVGMGMIFDETYRPFFEAAHAGGLYDRRFGLCEVELAAVASRTGGRRTLRNDRKALPTGRRLALGRPSRQQRRMA